MPLSNAQYDEIMRGYGERQIRNRHISAQRIQSAYDQKPRLKDIDASIASISVKQAQKLLSGDKSAINE